jgi:signal transduction histidine kinase
MVVLSVIDSGKGMAPEVAAKAFRPFFSTRSGGSGLGLPTARKIVEAHGGSIKLQSERGRGTKFTIRLPAPAGRGRESEEGGASGRGRQHRTRAVDLGALTPVS